MSILGNRVLRREDNAFLTTGGDYVDGLKIEDAAHVVYVRSLMAHATITRVDVSEARSAPGVVAVFTAEDIAEVGLAPNALPTSPDEMKPTFLASDTVRHVGQPIVAVVAETLAEATDATELVYVDYEPLPVVLDLEESVKGETLLFPEFGSNIVNTMSSERTADFSECEVVVEERIMNQRLTAGPIEPRAGAALWTDDGRLVHYSACQGAHPTRDALAQIFELETGRVRVVVPDVGGGFGAKSAAYPEELILGFYARAIGRPVRWTETRSENIMAMAHGRGQLQFAKLGGTRDGRITGYQLDVIQDCGANPLIDVILVGMTQQMLTGTYDITNVGFTGRSVVTNMVAVGAYRGAGRPEATVAIERMIDRFADEIGMDPVEVRFKNLVPRFTEPYTTGIGTTYDVGDYPEALRLAMRAVGYEEQRAEQARRRENGDTKLLGIGASSYVEITAGGTGGEFGSVELQPDGRVRVMSGATPFGQGHETTWAMIVADRTGLAMDIIDVVHGDTDLVERGGRTVGSRSVQLGGSAIAAATTQLIERAKELAAAQLEAAVADIVLDPDASAFHVVGTPAVAVGWTEVAAELDQGLLEFHDFTAEMPTFPCGAHIAVVEVDRDTGETTVVRMVAVDDAGRLLNPLLAEGQIHGGLAQGIAQVLYESIEYDEDGTLKTSNFMDYLIVSPTEVPSFETVQLETPTWVNELGAKGAGESGTIGSIPAVYNAVIDAVSHLGVRHMELPLTPQKIWSSIDQP
jgi:carbon-monoxide dehydrogenase large subunit